jgi:uncharacterized MAPEG superfamily protein
MLAYSAVLAWTMIMTAAMIRTGGSFVAMFGNRDDLGPPSPLAERADRAAKNMLENLVLFTAAWIAAKAGGATGWRVTLGAQLFLAARLVYFPLYLGGVKVVRTLAWATGVAGTALLVIAACR